MAARQRRTTGGVDDAATAIINSLWHWQALLAARRTNDRLLQLDMRRHIVETQRGQVHTVGCSILILASRVNFLTDNHHNVMRDLFGQPLQCLFHNRTSSDDYSVAQRLQLLVPSMKTFRPMDDSGDIILFAMVVMLPIMTDITYCNVIQRNCQQYPNNFTNDVG